MVMNSAVDCLKSPGRVNEEDSSQMWKESVDKVREWLEFALP